MLVVVALAACRPEATVPPSELPTVPVVTLRPQWTDLTAWPCAVDELGDVHCWTTSEDDRTSPIDNPVPEVIWGVGEVQLVEQAQGAVFVLDGGILRTLHCRTGETGEGCFDHGFEGPFLAYSEAGRVGLTEDQHLEYQYWHESKPNPDDRYLLLGDWLGALDTRFRLRIQAPLWEDRNGEYVIQVHLDGNPVAMASSSPLVYDQFRFEAGGCVLDDTGDVDCVGGFAEFPFDTGTWSHLVGWASTVCAVRVLDDVVVCHDGWLDSTFELDWGPIRKLAVHTRPLYRDLPSVCAITERNELKCDGPRFDEAFQAELEAMNDLRRNPG